METRKACLVGSKKKENYPSEIVRRVTRKGHEVIDVDGLIVCRTRSLQKAKQPSTEQTAEQLSEEPGYHFEKLHDVEDNILRPNVNKTAQTSQEEHDDTTSSSRVLPGATEGVAVVSQDWTDACLSQAKECLQKLPQGGAEFQEDRLVQLCIILKESVLGRIAAENSASEPVISALESVLNDFASSVANAVGSTIVCQNSGSVQPPSAQVASKQAELAALQSSLQALKQEEVEWLQLENAVRRAHTVADQAVETEWQQRQEVNVPGSSTLQETARGTHKTLSAQVDQDAFEVLALQALIKCMEDLEMKAELQCSEMQADYHKEKFRTFPHIDSPARLIHEIVRPRKARLAPSKMSS